MTKRPYPQEFPQDGRFFAFDYDDDGKALADMNMGRSEAPRDPHTYELEKKLFEILYKPDYRDNLSVVLQDFMEQERTQGLFPRSQE